MYTYDWVRAMVFNATFNNKRHLLTRAMQMYPSTCLSLFNDILVHICFYNIYIISCEMKQI
jgi:hypothetical protein